MISFRGRTPRFYAHGVDPFGPQTRTDIEARSDRRLTGLLDGVVVAAPGAEVHDQPGHRLGPDQTICDFSPSGPGSEVGPG